jgi:hypothetical protein
VSRPDHKRNDDEDASPLGVALITALIIAIVLAAMFGYSKL